MRTFRHLTRAEITEIVLAHSRGATRDELARKYAVDPSTISYHARRYSEAYDEQGSMYALIKSRIKKTCLHPSSKCTLCGVMRDEIYRSEWRRIEELQAQLADAQRKLRRAGLLVD